jgi:hypothetical protein
MCEMAADALGCIGPAARTGPVLDAQFIALRHHYGPVRSIASEALRRVAEAELRIFSPRRGMKRLCSYRIDQIQQLSEIPSDD